MCNGWQKGGNASTDGKHCGEVESIWNFFFYQIYTYACMVSSGH